ncbi:MAG: hypothetical protein NDJ90_13085 [Oligoflexia bacterium]|nr:hypothetical protein [Oligoflexia bacterium]
MAFQRFRELASSRLTAILFLGGWLLCLLGAFFPQDPTSGIPLEKLFPSEALYLLRRAGVTDVFHSVWLRGLFVLLGLNQLVAAILRLREGRRLAFVSHFSAVLLLVALGTSSVSRFEAQVTMEEGASPVKYLQVNGREGFFEPGFEFAAGKSALHFFSGDAAIGSRRIGGGHPAYFRGFLFIQGAVGTAGPVRYRVAARERPDASLKVAQLAREEIQDLGGATVRVVDSQVDDEYGARVQLEYREGEQAPERFWVFEKFPSYDEVRRKKSRYVFTFGGAHAGFTTQLRVVRDPALPWIALSAALLLGALLARMLVALRRPAPSVALIDRAMIRIAGGGFLLLTGGLIALAGWRTFGSGRLWAWEPREIGLLALWFWFGAYVFLKGTR